MDIDAYVAVHQPTWQRLESLLGRSRSRSGLSGTELDELVDLYQRTATHLSVVRTSSPDPQLVGRLSGLVARARAVIGRAGSPVWRDVATFVVRTFPAAAWRVRHWWAGCAGATFAITASLAIWIATHPAVRARLLPASTVLTLEQQFSDYYSVSSHPVFTAQVWTHNAALAAGGLVLGLLLGLPTLYFLALTGIQVGVPAGYLIASGHTGEFFGLILPHGMLELTAVFLAFGAGLRLGWTVIDPGPNRTRSDALAQEGRATVAIGAGVTAALLVSGLLEGFVTPSGLPPVLRVLIGAVAVSGFTAYVGILGSRAVRAGVTGDVASDLRDSVAPAL